MRFNEDFFQSNVYVVVSELTLKPFEEAARWDFEQDAGHHWNYWKAETPKKYSENESPGM